MMGLDLLDLYMMEGGEGYKPITQARERGGQRVKEGLDLPLSYLIATATMSTTNKMAKDVVMM